MKNKIIILKSIYFEDIQGIIQNFFAVHGELIDAKINQFIDDDGHFFYGITIIYRE